jgi:hypothetical protein
MPQSPIGYDYDEVRPLSVRKTDFVELQHELAVYQPRVRTTKGTDSFTGPPDQQFAAETAIGLLSTL